MPPIFAQCPKKTRIFSCLKSCFSQKDPPGLSKTILATMRICFCQKSKKCLFKIRNWFKRLGILPKIGFLQWNVPMERRMQFWQPSREFVTKNLKSLLKVRIWFEKKTIFLKKHNFPRNDQLDTECSHDVTLVFFSRKIWMNAAAGAGTTIKTISFSLKRFSSKCFLDVKIAVLTTLLFFRPQPEKF